MRAPACVRFEVGPLVAIAVVLAGCGLAKSRPERDAGGPDAADIDAPVDTSLRDAGVEHRADADVDAASECEPAPETCNGRDDDCNGVLDDEPAASTWCGARCGVDVCPSARPTAPLASTLLTTRRPTFRWMLSGGADAARVDICRDRACTDLVTTLEGVTSTTPSEDLPRGVLFWRLVPLLAGRRLPAVSAPWVARIPSVGHAVDGATGPVLDVDGDGRADVLLRRYTHDTTRTEVVLYRGSDAGLVERGSLPPSVVSVDATADLDGDGRSDAIVHDGGHVALLDGASMLLGPSRAVPDVVGWPGVSAAGDLDADGYADLLLPPYSGAGPRIARGGAAGLDPDFADVPAPPYVEPGWDSVVYAVGDLDADGSGDLVAAQDCSHALFGAVPSCPTDRTLWRIRGGPLGLTTPQAWASVLLSGAIGLDELDTALPLASAGDVDGDGLVDLVATDVYSVAVTIAVPGGVPASPLVLLSRDATLAHDASTSLDAGRVVHWLGPACDLDGDGAGDVVLTSDDGTFLRRGGAGGLRSEVIQLSPLGATGARCLGDDDGDGLSELAVLLYDPSDSTWQTELHVHRGLDPRPVQILHVGVAAGF